MSLSRGDSNRATSMLKLGGLSGQEDASAVEYTLGQMDGVLTAQVNLADHTVSVEYDRNKIKEEMITGTLHSLGHSILEAPDK